MAGKTKSKKKQPLDTRSKMYLVLALCSVMLLVCIGISLALIGWLPFGSAAPQSVSTVDSESMVTESGYNKEENTIDTQAYTSTILEQSADAGESYIDETLFLGDSNTARMYRMFDYCSYDNAIGSVGMSAKSLATFACVQLSTGSGYLTMPQAVAKLQPRRVILTFGTNDLNPSYKTADFIKNYQTGIEAVVTAYPSADIIVNAIPPIGQQHSNQSLTQTQVDEFNKALVEMCKEKGWKFLNSAEVLRDDATGWAKTDYTLSDGVHLSKKAVEAYFTYVRTHAYQTEDRRPQPLGSIPQPDGVPANLITKDPIAVRGAKVPLEFVAEHGGTLSGTTSQLVKKGATAGAVTAVPDAGFVFAGWTASSGGSYSSESLSFTMPQDADAGGVVLTAHFKADAHEHNYAEIEDTRVNPTCTTNGSAKYTCTICGEIIEKELPALGHDWDGGVRSGDYITYYCRREGCSETKTEESQHTHTYDEGIVTQAATCGAPGVLTRTCAICGQQIQEEIPATGQHSWQQTEHVDAQVGVEGRNVYTCTVCGQTYSEVLPALEPPPPPDPVTPVEPTQPDPPAEPTAPETPAESTPAEEQPEVTAEPASETPAE